MFTIVVDDVEGRKYLVSPARYAEILSMLCFFEKTWVNWLENKNKNKPIEGYNVKLIKLTRITQSKWAAWSNNTFTLKFSNAITLKVFKLSCWLSYICSLNSIIFIQIFRLSWCCWINTFWSVDWLCCTWSPFFTQKKAVIRFCLDILSMHSWIGAVNVALDSF